MDEGSNMTMLSDQDRSHKWLGFTLPSFFLWCFLGSGVALLGQALLPAKLHDGFDIFTTLLIFFSGISGYAAFLLFKLSEVTVHSGTFALFIISPVVNFFLFGLLLGILSRKVGKRNAFLISFSIFSLSGLVSLFMGMNF